QKQNKLRIESSSESFQTWINRSYVSNALREQISKANFLLVPAEGYAEKTDMVYFPTGTADLFQFIRESDQNGLLPEVCIDDRDYKELARHADVLYIASAIVSLIIAPIAADLIGEYIKRRLFPGREDDTEVNSRLTIYDDKSGRSVDFIYKGPAREYRSTLLEAISQLNGQERGKVSRGVKASRKRLGKGKRQK
ncbi:MAG TPA: hypothetical protein VNJ29_01740, partial [Candidatus Nitrosotenuis sp.]|nr:hypothetical protein [Candidatus Nitrosotenuis sp.]